MTLLELYEYFEAFAIADPDLQHDPEDLARTSFVATLQEAESAEDLIKSSKRDLVMALIPYDKQIAGARSESFIWGKTVCFVLVKKVTKNAKAKEIITSQSLCEQICDDVVRKLIADRADQILMVDLDSIAMKPIGPVSDGRYGYICMFQLEDYFEHWQDPDRTRG